MSGKCCEAGNADNGNGGGDGGVQVVSVALQGWWIVHSVVGVAW